MNDVGESTGAQADSGSPGPVGALFGSGGPPGRAGRLFGVGVGPGDPDLITVKGARIIGAADVVAYYSGTHGRSLARGIAETHFPKGVIEEALVYPVTTGASDHPLGYYGAIADFYDEAADRLRSHLTQGRDVVVIAEGDPLFYGSYMYLHDRLSDEFETAVVPGITSVSAGSAALADGLCRHEDVLSVLPGTLSVPELARRLADTDAAVVMKLGRTFPGVVEALRQAGRLQEAWYIERASSQGQRVCRVVDVDSTDVPYMSLILVVGRDTRADAAGRASVATAATGTAALGAVPNNGTRVAGGGAAQSQAVGSRAAESPAATARVFGVPDAGELLVVGLGPGPERWLTPEVKQALAAVKHVVGYGPYVARVPQREGLIRHVSGNTVELDRAREALELARRGEPVAVVSGGDAGVFGMAAAVFEAAEDPRYARVPVRVLPGVTAAQAVAARAGAPLGADFAVVSLSDRLKPWAVIERRLRAVAEADLVLAVYNPASRTRTEQISAARDVLLDMRGPQTVVVVGREVGRSEESLTITTLADLDPATIDMKCLVIVGAKGTRVTVSGQVWTPRFVPG